MLVSSWEEDVAGRGRAEDSSVVCLEHRKSPVTILHCPASVHPSLRGEKILFFPLEVGDS